MSAPLQVDFLVLGGGSAGYAGARTAVEHGLKTAVIDGAEQLGGLCILRGCMPSKTYIESANRYLTLRHAAEFGLRTGEIGFDAGTIRARKRRLIAEFADYRREQLEGGRFDLLRGSARMVDAHRVEVTSGRDAGRQVEARQILVATGSVIHVPDFAGLERSLYMTSDEVLEMEAVPQSVIVLGVGPIALEFAHYFSALGSEVHVLLRGEEILRGVDRELAGALREALEKRGARFYRQATDWHFSKGAGDSRVVEFDWQGSRHRVEAETILAATGRRPATDGLALDAVGVHLEKGRVVTDERQCTAAGHIYAAGDVTGPHEIVHIAIEQGEIAARNAARAEGKLDGEPEKIHYRELLFGVFTWPQLAVVGMDDEAARKAGYEPVSASYPFDDHGKSLVMDETDGLVKLTADRKTGRLLSGGVVGPEGVELIHEVGMAIHYEATVHTFMRAPHYHPTLSEIWTYPAEELSEVCGRTE